MKYYVRVCRPRFEVALIQVNEDDTDGAAGAALAKADLGVNWVLLPFDAGVYTPHVELTLGADDVKEISGSTSKAAQQETLNSILSVQAEEHSRYLLLYADTNLGDGKALFQPWFMEPPVDVMHEDLISDWRVELKQYLEGQSFEDALDDADSPSGSADILPFAKGGDDDKKGE